MGPRPAPEKMRDVLLNYAPIEYLVKGGKVSKSWKIAVNKYLEDYAKLQDWDTISREFNQT